MENRTSLLFAAGVVAAGMCAGGIATAGIAAADDGSAGNGTSTSSPESSGAQTDSTTHRNVNRPRPPALPAKRAAETLMKGFTRDRRIPQKEPQTTCRRQEPAKLR